MNLEAAWQGFPLISQVQAVWELCNVIEISDKITGPKFKTQKEIKRDQLLAMLESGPQRRAGIIKASFLDQSLFPSEPDSEGKHYQNSLQ